MSADNSSETGNSEDISSSAPKALFLILFLLMGSFGNVVMLVSIGCNKKHYKSPLFIFSANLAFINCVNCFFNIPITLASTLAGAWNMGESVCRMNAFFMNLVIIETLLTLTFMALDRMRATKDTSKYEKLKNIPRSIIMIAYSWAQALCFSLPVLFQAVPVKVYPDIYICIISEKTSIAYTCVLILGCFLIPLIVTIVFYSVIIRTCCTERAAVQNILTQHQYSKDIEEPSFVKEMKSAKFSAFLFFSWLFMEVPFIICLFGRILGKSDDLNLETKVTLHYSWYVDIILLWIKYGYVLILPIFALIWKKELWQNFKDTILCRKSNLVDDMTNKDNEENQDVRCEKLNKASEEKMNVKEELKEAFVSSSGFQVPVLFATSNGVHIQTFGADELSESEIMYDDIGIRGKKCDVLGSQGHLHNIGDDTSDYDSSNEIDPFSVSHPISSKRAHNPDNAIQRRSNSQPEVRGDKSLTKTECDLHKTSVTLTSAVDSGLDISAGKTITNSALGSALREISKAKCEKQNVQNELITKDDTIVSTSHENVTKSKVEIAGKINNKNMHNNDEAYKTTKDVQHMEGRGNPSSDQTLPSQSNESKDDIENRNRKQETDETDILPPIKINSQGENQDKKKKDNKLSSGASEDEIGQGNPLKPPPRLKPLKGNKLSIRELSNRIPQEDMTEKLGDIQDDGQVNSCSGAVTPSACNLMDIGQDFSLKSK
ncbi:hypothetical protein FSP39_002004 [Pinctada imbricata]|uniref:G-protein coupled receptors family 1 profile domain-containing protein n=1 Tax=Pinctada imbricata TaxID=66713 RepID=A0AA88YDE2_PINIB|nr:hypothetical protein FSP39_002004 [Pinctada imbricata]